MAANWTLRVKMLPMLVGMFCSPACIESTTYTPLPPDVPRLRVPANGAFVGSVVAGTLRPSFAWAPSAAKDAVHYEIQISTDSTFAKVDVSAETVETSYQPDAALSVSSAAPVGRAHFWRVKACVPLSCSEYSSPWRVSLGRSATDFNGDGYSDMVIGAPGNTSSTGQAVLYLGAPGATYSGAISGTMSRGAAGDGFGTSVAAGGDFNGDGFSDLLIGAPGNDATGTDAGRAYIYFGAAVATFLGVPDVVLSISSAYAHFGQSVAFAGDVNGDGYSDVVVGAPDDDVGGVDSGRAYVYFGGAAGALDTPDGTINGDAIAGRVGSDVAAAGDINGDGFADVIVNRGNFLTPNLGDIGCSTRIYLGGAGGLDTTRSVVAFDGDFQVCALRAASAGDLDGDGRADLLLGINRQNGRSLLRLAAGSDSFDSASRELLPLSTGSLISLSPVADLNADGIGDVLVNRDQGLAYLGGEVNQEFSLSGITPATLLAGGTLVSVGDVNGDGFDDALLGDSSYMDDAGRALLYLGGPGQALDATVDSRLSGSDVRFGISIASAPPASKSMR